jgi:hypothetical protein
MIAANKMPLIPRTPLSPGRTVSRINGGITIRPLNLEHRENVAPLALSNTNRAPLALSNTNRAPLALNNSNRALSALNSSNIALSPPADAYDRFAQRFFAADARLQQMLIEHIVHLVPHPIYRHLLQTMTRENAVHVMGYLRSQRDVRLYEVLMGL